jgi:Zn-dependent protease
MNSSVIATLAIVALPIVFAITLHEAAHGYVAKLFGDRTAEMLGRVTLNPIKHVDPVGTILVPGLLVLLKVPFVFGWAKPVPVNFANLRHPKRDMIWVAAAGPGINLLMAIGWAIMLKLLMSSGMDEAFFIEMARAGVFVNIGLMALNLLPLPPLDGGRILVGLLPHQLALAVSRVEPYGFFILIFLLATNTIGFFLQPFYEFGVAIVRLFV